MKVEDTKIYAVLKEVFGSTPEWKEVYDNLKQVVDTNNNGLGFDNEDRLIDCFVWGDLGGYWSTLDGNCLEFKNKQKETMKKQVKEPELISMDKEYTRNEAKVRVLCIDRKGDWPVVVMDEDGNIYGQSSTGISDCSEYYNLEEYNPWQDVAVDTKILLGGMLKRHFAKYENNKVYYFMSGKTSFTAEEDKTDAWPATDVILAE